MTAITWYTVEEMPWPVDWSRLFGREAPVLMEIGFGTGQFLSHLARQRPDANLLGVEIALPSLRNAARKVERAGLGNVLLLRATAKAALHALCAPQSLYGVTVNFPDPWPKEGHRARRLIQDDFLRLLATRTIRGADLDIATDHADYAMEIEACLRQSSHFESRLAGAFVRQDPSRTQTKYEQLALSEGRMPYYFKWRRNDRPTEDRFPPPQELAMPHVVLRTPARLAELGRSFQPAHIEPEGIHIRFLEAYLSFQDDALLIETYVNEDPIIQRVALALRTRAANEVVIELHRIGFPRPTRGIHLAIRHLTRWVEQEYPSTIVVNSTLQASHAIRDN